MSETIPISITIVSNSELAERLSGSLDRLNKAFGPAKSDVALSKSDDDDLASLDPATIQFFLEIGKVAGNAVIGLIAKEVCVWLWNEAKSMLNPAKPTVSIAIGQDQVIIPAEPSAADREKSILAVEAALAGAVGRAVENPK